jgi:hypothetical protein
VMVDESDPVLRAISRLTVLTPDARRAVRLSERCRARMRRAPQPERRLGLALFGSLCVLYLAGIAIDLLRLQGTL